MNTRALLAVALWFLSCFSAALAEDDPSLALRVFPEKERVDMLTAYHGRMNAPQHLPTMDLKAWEARKTELRQRILADNGLDPLPPLVPLDLTYGDQIEREDCTITRVRWQTFPGLYATGFLYMPKQATFPAPAVLNPHGHWAKGSADDIVQARCLGLAHRGYVSLAVQYEHFHDLNLGVTMRGVWMYNNMRGIDVLQSLPQVDKTRIGVTGASGGGLQSMDIAAADERIKCAVIAVYPTYYERILYKHARACFCNFGPLGALTYTDQQQYVAEIAPRPTLMFTVTGDWTAQSIDDELPEVVGVFDLFPGQAGPQVADLTEGEHRILTNATGRFMVERWPGPHDYTQAMRERMYWWMDWWLQGKHEATPPAEKELKLEPADDLLALKVDCPQAHDWTDRNLSAGMRAERLYTLPTLRTAAQVAAFQKSFRARLTDLLGETGRTYGKKPDSVSLGTETVGDWSVERLWYASEPDVKIPAWLIRKADDQQAKRDPMVLLLPNGKADLLTDEYRKVCDESLKAGGAVLAIDWRLRGEWAWKLAPPGKRPEITWVGNGLVWGRPELGMAVCDVRRALDYLSGRPDCTGKGFAVVGKGDTAGYVALLAAALDDRIATAQCDLNHGDFAQGPPGPDPTPAPLLPKVLRYGDAGEIAACVAPRALVLTNVNSRTAMATARAAYALLKKEKDLNVKPEETLGPANGSFEEGSQGWTVAEGPPTVTVESATPLQGKSYLHLLPGQTVLSEAVTVKPGFAYRLYAEVRKGPADTRVFLQRGDQRDYLARDYTDRAGWEECVYDFAGRAGETSVRIGFAAANVQAARETALDAVRVVEMGQLPAPPAEGTEVLSLNDFTGQAVGPFTPAKWGESAKWMLGYGPHAKFDVVAAGNEGRPALHVVSGPGEYAALSTKPEAPLQRGTLYRVSVTAKGKASLSINFWGTRNNVTPVVIYDLSDEWKTYTIDWLIDSPLQTGASPVAGITGEAWLDRMEMQVVGG